jgi:hypothetical protein
MRAGCRSVSLFDIQSVRITIINMQIY